jgi:hypothetical protein
MAGTAAGGEARVMGDGRLARAVRQQIGLGRIVPLGGPADGAWIAESAAAEVLRRAAEAVGGVRVGTLRIGLADEDGQGGGPVAEVPGPMSALPPRPLRVTADFGATAERPLPVTADAVRAALAHTAAERLGLVVAAVDLEVSGLLDGEEPPAAPEPGPTEPAVDGPPEREGDDPAHAAVRAARAVPGVARLDPGTGNILLGSPLRTVAAYRAPGASVEDREDPAGRHTLVHVATAPGHRVLEVTGAVRSAVAPAVAEDAPGPVTVAVLVTSALG